MAVTLVWPRGDVAGGMAVHRPATRLKEVFTRTTEKDLGGCYCPVAPETVPGQALLPLHTSGWEAPPSLW